MMKRTLSLLLCLIMVLSFAAPAVQAADSGDDYSNILDGIHIEDGSNVEIVIDGNTVTSSQDTKLPNPADLMSGENELPYVMGAPVVEESVAEKVCTCVDLASAVEHGGVCMVKAPYMTLCEASADELFAQWGNYTLVEQAFMLKYLYEAFPLKYNELEKLLTAPTGSASETYVDGTTVSVEGIPQDGSLTVGEAADEIKDIVDAYVAENEEASSPLFGYDVSVQDAEGADWQPETSVKMELELPGEKLHKNTKVFVVHVDDNGVATTIEATVTEDGKIAFETPGFSAFYGFTVDFHYEDVVFSIPGMSSIKLSELFAQLNVPLNASDVVALDYTDDTQIKIEQLEGDWRLTSLKAFSTEEKLTMTMVDGTVHEIKVTDAEVITGTHKWHLYNGYFGNYNHIYSETRFPYNDGYGSSYGSAYNTIFNGEFDYAYNHAAGSYYYWEDYDDSGPCTLFFDDVNQVTTINLASKTDKQVVYLDMIDEFVIRNCNVTLQLASDSSSTTKEIVIRSHNPAKPLFSIVNGSLTIKGSANTKIVLEFGANSNGTPKNLGQSDKYPLIWENGKDSGYKTTSRSLYLENVTFRHSAYSAIDLYYSQMTNVTLKNCSFESTVDNVSHGGAIRVRSENNLAMTKFEVNGCSFDGNHADARGGAIALQRGVQTFTILDSKFSNCSASTHAGAISLQGDVGNISITGTKTADGKGGYTYTTSFTNCTSVNRGGAVGANCSSFGDITVQNILVSGNEAGSLGGGLHFGNTDAKAPITGGAVSVSNCDFKDNMAHGIGGGLCVTDGEYESISVTNCTFDNCDTTGYGGALALKIASEGSAIKFSVKEDMEIIGCTFTNCLGGNLAPNGYKDATQAEVLTWDHDGDPATAPIDELNGASGGGAIIIGGDIGGHLVISGADENHPTLFENCLTWNNGGAIFFNSDLNVKGKTNSETKELEAVILKHLNINKCFARDSGSAIYFGAVVIPLLDMNNCIVQNCGYFDASDSNFPASLIEISDEWFSCQTVYDITGYDANGDPIKVKNDDLTAMAKAAQLARWKAYPKAYFYPGTDYSGTFRTVGNTACVAKISDCEFKYNRSYSNGGAVYWNANQVIYADPETKQTPVLTPGLTITNTSMHHNYAEDFGGALFCEGTVTIKSCDIYNNTAGVRGGGIAQNVYNNASRQLGESGDNETTTLILGAVEGGEPVKIYGNSAYDGGGISITIAKTNSYPHTIKSGITDPKEKEKPVNWIFRKDFTYDVTFRLGGTHVYENKATRNGGGIYYDTTYFMGETGTPTDGVSWAERQRQVDSFVKDISIDDGLIYSNIAGSGATDANGGGNGGGVYMNSNQVNTAENIPAGQLTGSSTVTITGGSIFKNKARYGNGGGVYLQGVNALCSITGATTTIGAQYQGTTSDGKVNLSTDGANTATSRRIAANNYSGGCGGGIAIFGGARIEMQGGYIVNNKAYTAGGGVAVHNAGSSMYLHDGYIDGNEASNGGGISLNAAAGNSSATDDKYKYGMYFDGGIVRNNIASYSEDNIAYGGGICLSASATMKFDGGEISGNKAVTNASSGAAYQVNQEGGGIAVCQGSRLDIYGGTIKDNGAYCGGGMVIRGSGSTVHMYPVYKQDSNGNVVTDSDGNPVIASQGLITNNSVSSYGGGIYGIGATLYMQGGTISNNRAYYGGGSCFTSNSNVTVDGATVSGNIAQTRGGGWYFRQTLATLNGGFVSDNQAQTGGGIRCEGRPSGLAADQPCIKITGGTISGNTATSDGAGIWMQNYGGYGVPSMEIYGGEISGNISSASGGGIFVHGDGNTATSLKMFGGTVSGNTAAHRGGGINADNFATVELSSLTVNGTTTYPTVTRNTANRGGGIGVCYGCHLTVKEGYITYNNAVGTTSGTTAYQTCDNGHGVGGGVWVAEGAASRDSVFTLSDEGVIAIYGNLAEFAGDDVFSNGKKTQLNIPVVQDMDLAGYDFTPEGWFEDYNTSDSAYIHGLQMLVHNGTSTSETPVLRYRNANAVQRRYMHIIPKHQNGNNYVAGATNASYQYINKYQAYVAMTLGIPAAADDTVVIDFSTAFDINLWQNDLFMEIDDFAKDKTTGEKGSYLGYLFPNKTSHKDGVYYTSGKNGALPVDVFVNGINIVKPYGSVWNGENGRITYIPRGVDKLGEDQFFYAVEHNEIWYYARVNVIPATSVYFDDTSAGVKYHTQADTTYDTLTSWSTDGSYIGLSQGEDRPGLSIIEGLDADNIYGYDGSYDSLSEFFSGSAHWVQVHRNADGTTVNARASFTFTGTGFDIISLCNPKTGLVMVSIYEGVETNFDSPTKPIVKSYMVDTYYETKANLYQVPVIKASGLDYGTYTAEIYVAPSWLPNEHAYEKALFWLDAIRIYDPMGPSGEQSNIAQDAYIADHEAWPSYQELRNLFLKQTDLKEDEVIMGTLFIDGGDGMNSVPTVKEYKSFGPNNEVYLKKNQAIAFTMNASAYAGSVDKIHLGLRGMTGMGNVKVTVREIGATSGGTEILHRTLPTTDMYYDISGAKGKVIVVSNIGDNAIAISNLKVTHTEAPPQEANVVNIITTDANTIRAALDIMTPEQLVDPVVKPKYPALSFEGMVCYNVFFTAEELGDLTAADLGLAVFNSENPEGTVENADEVHLGAQEIDGLYMVATDGVHAKYLGETKYFRAFAKKADGTYIYSKMVSYSALDYAENVLTNSDDVALKQLVVAMLNYGAEAQKFFKYNTDDLMNKALTAEQQALVSGFNASSLNTVGKVDTSKVGAFASNGGFAKKYPAISFKGAFEINYFFKAANVVDGDMTLYFWNEGTYNSVSQLTAENADKSVAMTLEDGSYTAASDEIAAKDLDKTIYVAAVYESNGVTYCSGVLAYSIAAYCQNAPADVQALANAAAIYGCTAKQFFRA